MAGALGFEPRMQVPKTRALPLGYAPILKKIKLNLENLLKPDFIRMTGSGSALVAYFKSKERCELAKKRFNKKYKNYWCIASKTI